MTQINKKRLSKTAAIAIAIGVSVLGLSLNTQAQDQVAQEQNAALQAVAKMVEGQRTYYEKNGKFQGVVKDLQKDFGITLPKTFDYAIRTTTEAAYSYVIPAKSPLSGKLTAYVGAAFITPNEDSKITTIICENTTPGQLRPADPQLIRGVSDPSVLNLQCEEFSVKVPASEVNE